MRKKIELLILSFIAALAIVLGIAQTTKVVQINNDQKVVTLSVSRVATFLIFDIKILLFGAIIIQMKRLTIIEGVIL
ncbi:hypothetical protein NBRC111452_1015 [Companilactobacillus farciminis]|nr:hypothetical protein NBRC111452_1015 [Companilactobacillus farciminis]